MESKKQNVNWRFGSQDPETRKPSLDLNAFLDPTSTIAKEILNCKESR